MEADNEKTKDGNDVEFVLAEVSIENTEYVVVHSEDVVQQENSESDMLTSGEVSACLKNSVLSDIKCEESTLLAENVFTSVTSTQKSDTVIEEAKVDRSVQGHNGVDCRGKLLDACCSVLEEKLIGLDSNKETMTLTVVSGRPNKCYMNLQNNCEQMSTGCCHRSCRLKYEVNSQHLSSIENDGGLVSSKVAAEDSKAKVNTGKGHKYKCAFCKILPFNSEETLRRHIERHNLSMLPNAEGCYECSKCKKTFKTRANLATHMWIHKEKRFRCAECGKRFVQKVQLNVHISSVHQNQKPYLCSLCGKRYSQQAGLAYHLRVHKSEELKDEVIESEIMRKHGKRQDDEKSVLVCIICQEEFLKVIRWLYHLKKHLQSDVDLDISKKNIIIKVLRDNELFMKSQRVYECDMCNHVSFYSMDHTLHKAVHVKGNVLQCLYCKKTFSQQSNLKYHVRRIHQRLRCHICDDRHGTMKELTEHQVTKHGLDPLLAGSPHYQCKRCQYCTKQKSRLLFHMSQVHNISCSMASKFSCDWCGKPFATKYSKKLHERTHTNDQPFMCNICGKSFADPSNLIHHGTRSHPEVPKKQFYSKKC